MNPSADIDVRSFLGEVLAVVEWSGLVADVELVPSIQDWCSTHGINEDNPWCAGKTVRCKVTGRYLVLLAEQITASMVSSVLGAMELRGFESETNLLSTPLAFVRHLVLHDVAHGLEGARTEDECDKWAFTQLRQLPPGLMA